MTQGGSGTKRSGAGGGRSGARRPSKAHRQDLSVESSFERISARRGVTSAELFTDVIESGLVEPASQGQGWAVKMLVECLSASGPLSEPEQPLSPKAGKMIYEIVRSERAER